MYKDSLDGLYVNFSSDVTSICVIWYVLCVLLYACADIFYIMKVHPLILYKFETVFNHEIPENVFLWCIFLVLQLIFNDNEDRILKQIFGNFCRYFIFLLPSSILNQFLFYFLAKFTQVLGC